MSKRLQVIVKDPEYREIQRVARSRYMSIAEWVRQALDLARREEPGGGMGKKLETVRRAVKCEYPTGDIERMLEEIEMGCQAGPHSRFWFARAKQIVLGYRRLSARDAVHLAVMEQLESEKS